jgi:TonB family protein
MRSLILSIAIHLGLVALAVVFQLASHWRGPELEKPIELVEIINALNQQPKQSQGIKQPAAVKLRSVPKSQSTSETTDPSRANTDSSSLESYLGEGESLSDEFEASSLPVLLKEVRVPYPGEAIAARVQGSVKFDILVSSKGDVLRAVALPGSPKVLVDAALPAVLQFKFKPALLREKTVAIQIRYTYRFVLQ